MSSATTDTWHYRHPSSPYGRQCLHCSEGDGQGHYLCTEEVPCQDCRDMAEWHSENIAAGYGPWGEDTGNEWDY